MRRMSSMSASTRTWVDGNAGAVFPVHGLRLSKRDDDPVDRTYRGLSLPDRTGCGRFHNLEPISGLRFPTTAAGRAFCASCILVVHGCCADTAVASPWPSG